MSSIGAILRDRRMYRGTPAAVFVILLIVNVLIARREQALERARKENLLVSEQQSAESMPRYDQSVGEHPQDYIAAIPDARFSSLAFLIGMSQMYAINERTAADKTISEILDDSLKTRNIRVFGLAAPNLNNEEAVFLLLATAASPARTPRFFIYGLCFDKMRNVDLRPGYLQWLRKSPAVRAEVHEAATRYQSRYPRAAAKLRATLEAATKDTAALAGDSTFEQRLRARAADVLPMVRDRRELNSFVMYDVLYAARNKVFGITATSKRPILPGRYEMNKEMLELLMDEAQRREILPIAYIIPLNPQAENPYIPQEYEAFKQWAGSAAAAHHVPFANLEDVVPRQDWGLFMGGPDFKHFKGAGHSRTARSILERFGTALESAPGPQAAPHR